MISCAFTLYIGKASPYVNLEWAGPASAAALWRGRDSGRGLSATFSAFSVRAASSPSPGYSNCCTQHILRIGTGDSGLRHPCDWERTIHLDKQHQHQHQCRENTDASIATRIWCSNSTCFSCSTASVGLSLKVRTLGCVATVWCPLGVVGVGRANRNASVT